MSLSKYFALILLFQSCIVEKESIEQKHIDLQLNIQKMLDKALTKITRVGSLSKNMLEKYLNESNNCSGYVESLDFSLYSPRSSQNKKLLRCFLSSHKVLKKKWSDFKKENPYVSWLYVYDNNSKGLILYPKADTSSLFGENLSFEKFSFHKIALKKYPDHSWYGIKDDINGTGKILIYSIGMKIDRMEKLISLGIDLNTRQFFLKQVLPLVLSSVENNKSFFVLNYYKINTKERNIGAFFSSEENLNTSFRNKSNFNNEMFKAFYNIDNQFSAYRKRKVFKIAINEKNYKCTASKSGLAPLFTYVCLKY